MPPSSNDRPCPTCDSITRRRFVGTTTAVLAATAIPGRAARAAERRDGETLVAQLYGSLNEDQKKSICFPFGHPLQSKVDNNWFIVDHSLKEIFNADQRDLVRQIFRSIHSEAYADAVITQVEHDNRGDGGFDSCAVAIFGTPGTGKFQWVFTGRHVTRRCDGDSVDGAAFGGPIFYGHAAQGFNEGPDHPGNAYWFQAKRANEVFAALDGRQRAVALRDDPRREEGTATVRISSRSELHGIPCSELSADQKELVHRTMADLLAPFRKADADEALKLIQQAGGMDSLHMAFYKNMDIGEDGVWDVWQIEGPNMVWYFRGAPHVHTWVNIGA
jgi:hypothetical protein